MKILWLSHLVPYPPKGGVLQRAHHLLCELAKQHSVDLLAFNQRPLMRPLFSSIDAGLAEASRYFDALNIRHRFFPTPHGDGSLDRSFLAAKSLLRGPYNLRWLTSREFARALHEWLAETQYDLVHFDTISLYPYRNMIPPRTATALDHHNIESSMLGRRARNEANLLKAVYFWQEGLRLRRVERSACPRFAVNITCSDLDSEELRRIAPNCRVITIPNSVDTDYFQPGNEGDRPRLIFVGRLNWYPNLQAVRFIVKRLWPVVKRSNPMIEFDLVGANPPDVALQLARVDPAFRVHGFVQDVRPLLERASVYVCPITDGGGTKLKVLDAMAMGKALVAHPIACEGISVTDGQDVLLAASPEDYNVCIGGLLADKERRFRIGRAARLLVEDRYSAGAIGRELGRVYESVFEAEDPR